MQRGGFVFDFLGFGGSEGSEGKAFSGVNEITVHECQRSFSPAKSIGVSQGEHEKLFFSTTPPQGLTLVDSGGSWIIPFQQEMKQELLQNLQVQDAVQRMVAPGTDGQEREEGKQAKCAGYHTASLSIISSNPRYTIGGRQPDT